jgi:hypothetical protein
MCKRLTEAKVERNGLKVIAITLLNVPLDPVEWMMARRWEQEARRSGGLGGAGSLFHVPVRVIQAFQASS